MNTALLIGKDLRVLARSRVLLCALVVYPLLLAVLLALVARGAGSRPRVAYVDDEHLAPVIHVYSTRINYAALLRQVSQRVTLVRLGLAAANAALADGDVVAVIHIPAGFTQLIRSTIQPGVISVTTRGGDAGAQALSATQAFVFQLNLGVQRELLREAVRFLRVIVTGGTAQLGSAYVPILGLRATTQLVAAELGGSRDPVARHHLDQIRGFTTAAEIALGFAEPSLRTVASPVVIDARQAGSDDLLGNHGLAVVIAVGVVLCAILTGAAGLAAERDENTLGRLLHGRVSLGELIAAKIAAASIVAAAIGIAVTLVNQLVARVAATPSPPLRTLLPSLPVIVLAAGAAAAVGTLIATAVRDLAGSTLVAVLVALPFVIAGVGPHTSGTVTAAAAIFPFQATVDGLSASLYGGSSSALARAILVLVVTVIAAAGLARFTARRLVA